ncbi:MAG TPA: RHS repeat-associated core domain-containing protein [Smithellaceae bacterium]|nr:RHS repeat-associated core domain-containing protein [Smithellaceae bacterium]
MRGPVCIITAIIFPDFYNSGERLYDPVIGRFISADSIVPYPFNPQSLNRYSYCRNNPMIYVDPSGHFDIQMYYGDEPAGGFDPTYSSDFNADFSQSYTEGFYNTVAVNNSTFSGGPSNTGFTQNSLSHIAPGSNNDQGGESSVSNSSQVGPANSVVGQVAGVVTAKAGVYNSVLTGEARELQKHGNFKIDGRDKIYKKTFYGNQRAVTSKEVVKNAKAAQASLAKFGKFAGVTLSVVSVVSGTYEANQDGWSDRACAKLTANILITGVGLVPVVGPAMSFGLTIANSVGAFDPIYNSFDNSRRRP